MAISPFIAAINQICDEKGLSKDAVIETIEAAIAAAYRKDYGKPTQIIRAEMDEESGQAKFWQVFDVVEEVEEPESQKTLEEAKEINKKAKVGETVEIALETHSDFGRIAAQTAKQVITQRIREAERTMILGEFKDKEGTLINGVIQQVEAGNVIVDLGKINGIMPPQDQVHNEKYYSGQRIKVYVKEVSEGSRGPRVLISRSDPGLVLGLFENEVPEIATGSVEVKGIAREAGSRSKVAVFTSEEGLDPVGSCVGQRGTRIQAVLAELQEEKIDIILWNEDTKSYIGNALSPAKISKVELDNSEHRAKVFVPEDQLSLAIGTGGQNVRLASKLTSWALDIEKIEGEENADAENSKNAAADEKEKQNSNTSETDAAETPKKAKKRVKKDKPEEEKEEKIVATDSEIETPSEEN